MELAGTSQPVALQNGFNAKDAFDPVAELRRARAANAGHKVEKHTKEEVVLGAALNAKGDDSANLDEDGVDVSPSSGPALSHFLILQAFSEVLGRYCHNMLKYAQNLCCHVLPPSDGLTNLHINLLDKTRWGCSCVRCAAEARSCHGCGGAKRDGG